MVRNQIVLDSGFALESIMPTTRQTQDDALAVMAALANGSLSAIVPWLFYAEIAAGCAKGVRGRRLDAEVAVEFMQELPFLAIETDGRTATAEQLYRDAMHTGAQAYDSIYLMLAVSMGLPVATLDKGMQTAVRAMRLTLFNA